MYLVEVADSQDCLAVDASRLEDVVRTTLAAEQVAAAEISVAVVDNATIRRLNRQYLEHDYDTDVLSFLLDCEPEPDGSGPATDVPRGRGKKIEGEIIVSAEMAADMAADFSWSPAEELVLYVIHGLLHLTGYDDLSEPEQQFMRRREREILHLCGIQPADHSGDRDGSGNRPGNRIGPSRRTEGADS